MKTLLIVTVGAADVQFCEGGQRRELARTLFPKLSSMVETNQDWCIGDSPVSASKEGKPPPLAELPMEGTITFCTPKLDAVLLSAENHEIGSKLQISAVLLLDTRRQPTGPANGKTHDKDPSHAGPILARRIKEKLGVVARFGTYLTGNEALEDRAEPRDALIRREVVAKLDQACRDTIEQVKPDAIILTGGSGFPAVRSLVPEIIRLHAAQNIAIYPVDVPEKQSGSNGPDQAKLVPEEVRPHELFAARRRALGLVRRGHFLGAFGAVEHTHSEAKSKGWSEITSWTRVLEWLAHWASSLPLPSACDIPLLTYDGKGMRAVRSALQVELALRAGNIPSAVHGTVAFFESALMDHLDQRRTPVKSSNTIKGYRFVPIPNQQLIWNNQKDKKKYPFTLTTWNGEDLYNTREYEAGSAKTLVHSYLKEPLLIALELAITQHRLRDLRNDVAHNVPTETEMVAATKKMQHASLWSTSKPPQFLCQDLVKNVLTELGITVDGVTEPAKLCEKLISDVEQRILSPS